MNIKEKVLVVVDYQNDFVEGVLGFSEAKDLEWGICNKVKEYLDNGDKVVLTMDRHFDVDYKVTIEGKNLPMHCEFNSKGINFYGDLEELSKDKRILKVGKKTFEANHSSYLGLKGAKEILVIGVVTNICVLSNVIALRTVLPESTIIVDASLCASPDKGLHEKALDIMESMFIKIINR